MLRGHRSFTMTKLSMSTFTSFVVKNKDFCWKLQSVWRNASTSCGLVGKLLTRNCELNQQRFIRILSSLSYSAVNIDHRSSAATAITDQMYKLGYKHQRINTNKHTKTNFFLLCECVVDFLFYLIHNLSILWKLCW